MENWNKERQKQFLERIGLVIIIFSMIALTNIDVETLILEVIFTALMIIVFLMGMFMFLFTDELLELQYKSMKKKNIREKE